MSGETEIEKAEKFKDIERDIEKMASEMSRFKVNLLVIGIYPSKGVQRKDANRMNKIIGHLERNHGNLSTVEIHEGISMEDWKREFIAYDPHFGDEGFIRILAFLSEMLNLPMYDPGQGELTVDDVADEYVCPKCDNTNHTKEECTWEVSCTQCGEDHMDLFCPVTRYMCTTCGMRAHRAAQCGGSFRTQ